MANPTKCILKNNSGYELKIAIPPGGTDRFRGTDWADVAEAGSTIPVGGQLEIGVINDPGLGTAHWGWIYLYSGAKNGYIQLYVYIWKPGHKDNKYSLGYFDINSDEDNPQPSGVTLGGVSYDSNTNTATYDFSCTWTTCMVQNNSGYDLVVDVPLGEESVYSKNGGHWNFVLSKGEIIKNGEAVKVGMLGNPSENERNYFGWIYFYSTAKRRYVQLYIHSTSSLNTIQCSFGYFNKDSSESKPQPDGVLGSASYDSGTKTAAYNFSCTQTRCVIKNESGLDLFVGIPTTNSKQFKGEQMLDVLPPDRLIPSDKKLEVGSIGDPDESEPDYFGWIYFFSRKYNKYIQLYIRSSKNKENYECSLGPFDENSSKDVPQPGGTLGEASYDSVTNIATYILK